MNKMIDGSGVINDQSDLQKIDHPGVHSAIEWAVELCEPASVKIMTDNQEDWDYVRQQALKRGEEISLNMEGHRVHFDHPEDQARDKENTKYLLPEGTRLGDNLNTMNRKQGLKEIEQYLEGSMRDREMYIGFFCLGPTDSVFAIPAFQITDSAYVMHSEDILYRRGWDTFTSIDADETFYHFIHSCGEMEGNVSAELDNRRVYIDLPKTRVFSVNTQYAGNTIGLKKLAFRLAIERSSRCEYCLAEHMFLMGLNSDKDRKTYFAGAFPSGCGKTSTAMLPGQTVVGDDIAYLYDIDGETRGANVESGIFGIIRDVSPDDDPEIYDTLTSPGERIFTNVLIHDGKPYWSGMGKELPDEGRNYQGNWQKGMTDENGNQIPPSNPNARYTVRIEDLDNVDEHLHDPKGVPVEGIVYGGRDSDTSVPIAQAYDWEHGVFIGATIESETTSATLGEAGVREHNPMANLDFLSVRLGDYLDSHYQFGEQVDKEPEVFSVNYFLRDQDTGEFLNGMLDKLVWMMWAEGRVNDDYSAIQTPIGYIPIYTDLQDLFEYHLGKEYSREDYDQQFSIRVKKYLEKMERMREAFEREEAISDTFYDTLNNHEEALKTARQDYGDMPIPPEEFLNT